MVTCVCVLVPAASQHLYLVYSIRAFAPSVPAPMYGQACLQGHKAYGSAVHLFTPRQSSNATT